MAYKVIARSLNQEVLRSWLMVLLLLWFVLLGGRFSLYLAQAATGQLPGSMVLSLTLLKSFSFAVFAMPVAFFFAILIVLGRWNRDLESVALAASGLGPMDYFRLFLPTALLIAMSNAALSLYAVPESIDLGNRLKAKATQAADIKLWRAGRFMSLQEGKLLLFADALSDDGETMLNVFVQFREGTSQMLVSAEKAVRYIDEVTQTRYIMLVNGYRYDGLPGQSSYRQMKFDEYGLQVGKVASSAKKWSAMPTRQLGSSSELSAYAELQDRLSRPVSVIVLTLAGVILGRYLPGRSAYSSIIIGIIVFVVYYNLMAVIRSSYITGERVFLSGLWVHITPVALAWGADYLQRWLSGRRS